MCIGMVHDKHHSKQSQLTRRRPFQSRSSSSNSTAHFIRGTLPCRSKERIAKRIVNTLTTTKYLTREKLCGTRSFFRVGMHHFSNNASKTRVATAVKVVVTTKRACKLSIA
mmetsp:Transcript_33641/g.59078  ORF Transcript_33641/g.59078 Transcript_33641/m.59078 type:complete len:111 (-) Transcript_33641:1279-1611(-)